MAKRQRRTDTQIRIRLTGEMHTALQKAADDRNASLNAEIESRLGRSLEQQNLLPELLALKYGPNFAQVLRALAHAMSSLGRFAAVNVLITENETGTLSLFDWTQMSRVYAAAADLGKEVLDAAAPPPEADYNAVLSIDEAALIDYLSERVERDTNALIGRRAKGKLPDLKKVFTWKNQTPAWQQRG
jgi:hypothetical protein